MPKNELKELQNMKLKVSMPDVQSAMDSSQTMMALMRQQNAIFRDMVRVLQSLDQAARKRNATLQPVMKLIMPAATKAVHDFMHPKPFKIQKSWRRSLGIVAMPMRTFGSSSKNP